MATTSSLKERRPSGSGANWLLAVPNVSPDVPKTLPVQRGYTLTWLYYYRCGSTGWAFDLYLSGQQTSFSSKDPFRLKSPAGGGTAVEVVRKV